MPFDPRVQDVGRFLGAMERFFVAVVPSAGDVDHPEVAACCL